MAGPGTAGAVLLARWQRSAIFSQWHRLQSVDFHLSKDGASVGQASACLV